MAVEERKWCWLWFGGRELEVVNFRVEIDVTKAAWRSWLVHGCNLEDPREKRELGI